MPWWKAGNSSSPSAYPSDAQHMRDVSAPHQPRLTRQRKLRHLSDLEIGDLARSHSSLGNFHPRVSTSVPQPLPLPESGTTGRRNAMAVRGDVEEGNMHMELSSHLPAVEPIGERFVPPPEMGSRLCQPTARRSTDHVDVFGFKHGHNKNNFHDANTSEDGHYRLATPERGEATVGLCSPGFSPGRLSTGEIFPSAYMVPHIPHMWSAPELPSLEFIADLNLQTSMEKPFAGSDRSACSQTAKSPGPKSRNPSAPCSPLHSKMFAEMSTVRHENHGNANVHPLPRPPGAPLSLQPSFGHQMSSIPNQWQKGKLIGSGTFGNVYIAINRHTGALCAMKEVNLIPDDPKSAECIKQLQQAAAMFKILHESPHIPETLSAEGKDFLQLCFCRNPIERPTASQLLEHPFVTCTVQHDLHGTRHPFSGTMLSDALHGPVNKKFSCESNMKGKYSFNGAPSQPCLSSVDHQPLSALQF